MTIKQTTPVAAAMGVFPFLARAIFRRFPVRKLLKTVYAISLWAGMPRAGVHRDSPTAAVDPVAYLQHHTRRCLFMPP